MRFLLAAYLILSACTSTCRTRNEIKAWKCATPKCLYVVANSLEVMYIAVAQVRTQHGDLVPTAIAFFADPTTGKFILLEGDKDDVCVISIGDRMQIGPDHNQVMNLFLQNSLGRDGT